MSLGIIAKSDVKGVVLAAGFGKRLRPLTDAFPKPLLPFAGVPNLYLILAQFEKYGIDDVAVNAHYCWEKVATAVRTVPLETRVVLSLEKETILGTAGALPPLSRWRSGADLLVVNGDIVCTIDFSGMLETHYRNDSFATMAVLPRPHSGETGGEVIWVYNGAVVAIGGEAPRLPGVQGCGFACAHVLSDRFVTSIPKTGPSEIIPKYKQALIAGETISAYVHPSFWFDIGTPSLYLTAHMELLDSFQSQRPSFDFALLQQTAKKLGFNPILHLKGDLPHGEGTLRGPVLVPNSMHLGPKSVVGPYVVVSGECTIERQAHLSHSLILEGTICKAQSTYFGAIVGNGLNMQLLNRRDYSESLRETQESHFKHHQLI